MKTLALLLALVATTLAYAEGGANTGGTRTGKVDLATLIGSCASVEEVLGTALTQAEGKAKKTLYAEAARVLESAFAQVLGGDLPKDSLTGKSIARGLEHAADLRRITPAADDETLYVFLSWYATDVVTKAALPADQAGYLSTDPSVMLKQTLAYARKTRAWYLRQFTLLPVADCKASPDLCDPTRDLENELRKQKEQGAGDDRVLPAYGSAVSLKLLELVAADLAQDLQPLLDPKHSDLKALDKIHESLKAYNNGDASAYPDPQKALQANIDALKPLFAQESAQ